MFVMHLALGGCLKAPPVPYGLTDDTGGHITYVLGAARAQARSELYSKVEVVTRAFRAPSGLCETPEIFQTPRERLCRNASIVRLATASRDYLEKEKLSGELTSFTHSLLTYLDAAGQRPDVIHAHFADAAEVAIAVRSRFGIRFVYTPHSLGRDTARPNTARLRQEAAAITKADAIVVSSRDEAERQVAGYTGIAEGKTHCIPPGVTNWTPTRTVPDTAAAEARLAPFLRKPNRPLILALARPVAKKNLPALVEAFARTPGLRDRANLAIVAGLRSGIEGEDGERRDVLRALFDAVDRHDLHGIVALPRQHARSDVPEFYRLAARTGGVFVNPAHFEPFGLTLLEAAAAGLPVVATQNGGPSNIIAEIGHGTCVDPTDPGAIGAACAALTEDRAAWDAASRAGLRGAKRFSWSAWVESTARVYRDLSSPRGIPASPRRARGTPLLVCDIDATLTGCPTSARRFAAWHRADGMPFAVATGRSVGEARRILAEWSLPMPEAILSSVGTEAWLRTPDGQYRLCPRYAAQASEDWAPEQIADVLDRLPDFRWQAQVEQRRWKLSAFGDRATADRIRKAIAAPGLRARIVHSHGNLIDILPVRAGKAAAAAHWARQMGQSLDSVIAAGDSGNDIDLLQEAAASIVVANAEPALLQELDAHAGVIVARHAHAAGVLEGLEAHQDGPLSQEVRREISIGPVFPVVSNGLSEAAG